MTTPQNPEKRSQSPGRAADATAATAATAAPVIPRVTHRAFLSAAMLSS